MEKKIRSVKVLHNYILVTADAYTKEDIDKEAKENKIITISEGEVKPYQYVIAVGPTAREVAIGDCIKLNPQRYIVPKHEAGSLKDGIIGDNLTKEIRIPTVEINGEIYFKITDADIDYIVEWEESNLYSKPSIVI